MEDVGHKVPNVLEVVFLHIGVTSVSLAAAVSLVTLHTKVEGSMQGSTAT